MFKKPKKAAIRRVVGDLNDDLEADEDIVTHIHKIKDKNSKKDSKIVTEKANKKSLLSFADDEDEESEIFQVKKSSQSKKLMKQLDKERRKKRKEQNLINSYEDKNDFQGGKASYVSTYQIDENNENNSSKVQTEIHTDDFVLVVKKSEPESEPFITLNGRAALCAGKNDLSSEDDDEESTDMQSKHKFSQPDLRTALESGMIPNSAMIHLARKQRQKARELGDYIPMEERAPEEVKVGKRLLREGDEDDDGSDEERVEMLDINGGRELNQRKEAFLDSQLKNSSDDSDNEFGVWESQQIRKGVTSAQLSSACQENILTTIQKHDMLGKMEMVKLSTKADFLMQAYKELSNFSVPLHRSKKSENVKKFVAIQTSQEILENIQFRYSEMNELHDKHQLELRELDKNIDVRKLQKLELGKEAEDLTEQYEFYQFIRGYISDLADCFNEKVPILKALETRAINSYTKLSKFLIERRRQDVRDQAKEAAEVGRISSQRKTDSEEQLRTKRCAEREGRRTRRRREREKDGVHESHLDGMSSDDEISDLSLAQHREIIEDIQNESSKVFEDVDEHFFRLRLILSELGDWKRKFSDSYFATFIQLCIPRICGPLVRIQMVTWNPLLDNCPDLEEIPWFEDCIMYALEEENDEKLLNDNDTRLLPTIIEKVILPKLNNLVQECWDPLSTAQTLRLVNLIRKLKDYPSLRPNSKYLRELVTTLHDKMKIAIESDIFIPIFLNQVHEARSSFFQRQFSSGLKLFRNIISWQGILADELLKQLAISSLLNRYLLLAMRACSPFDAINKANMILYTLPRVWLSSNSPVLSSFEMFISLLDFLENKLDPQHPSALQAKEQLDHIRKKFMH